jgi:hypothetical protein
MRHASAALALLLLAVLAPVAQAQDQRCFSETGQCISGRIRQFWEQNSGLPVFGFPTTDQHEELVEGKPFQIQWFERNRLELHPENQPPYNVLLGRLGNEIRAGGSAQPAPQPKPLPAPSFNNREADPNAAVAPHYPVQIVGIDKSAEVVRLKNVSDAAVDLNGWRMCSIKGSQLHEGIAGSLAPGETRDFPYTNPGNIWNNSEEDDGALYNANGQLVSY